MTQIRWGIIGCGDVTEVKSGPAFSKVPHSSLVAVMRRDAAKAADYARRHHVPAWYSDADALINDPHVDAIYVATPPSSHEQYTLAALRAGKPVYVEKPMTVDAASAQRMMTAATVANQKLVVAHYRREQPYFKQIKQLIDDGAIGEPRMAQLVFYKKPLTPQQLQKPGYAWRVDPKISGGGLFHDLAPHQLDLMLYFFGEAERAQGFAVNQSRLYAAPDAVTGCIQFKSGLLFSGSWCFGAAADQDVCTITGSGGSLSFSVFGPQQIHLHTNGTTSVINHTAPQHVQQPMIEQVVRYFLGQRDNPCPPGAGVQVMQWIDAFSDIQQEV